MCKQDLALNSLQGLIGHKTQPANHILNVMKCHLKTDHDLTKLQQTKRIKIFKNFGI